MFKKWVFETDKIEQNRRFRLFVNWIVCCFHFRFDEKESVSGTQQLKSSVQKGIRTKLLENYPQLEHHIDLILPKKDAFRIIKCHEHIEILVNSAGDQLFFRQRDSNWMPTLRLFHKFPFFLTMLQVDKGAIRFVLSGANIMCPGLTSPGACMTPADKGCCVAIMAEGKTHALAIGTTTLSTEDMWVCGQAIWRLIQPSQCFLSLSDLKSTKASASKTAIISMTVCGTWNQSNELSNLCRLLISCMRNSGFKWSAFFCNFVLNLIKFRCFLSFNILAFSFGSPPQDHWVELPTSPQYCYLPIFDKKKYHNLNLRCK